MSKEPFRPRKPREFAGRYGDLLILEPTDRRDRHNRILWKAQCLACKKIVYVTRHETLRKGYELRSCRDCRDIMAESRMYYKILADGREMPLSEYCRSRGVSFDTIKSRVRYGWSWEQAMTTPVQGKQVVSGPFKIIECKRKPFQGRVKGGRGKATPVNPNPTPDLE